VDGQLNKGWNLGDIYRIHVSLIGNQPSVWRRVELSERTKLRQFHRILQIVKDFENYDLHEFVVGTP
jgi:hypothetical protein